LEASFERYRAGYLKAIADENHLASQTLIWLKGAAVTADRTRAVAEARRYRDHWARVYFVFRHMHEQLRFDEYAASDVRNVHRQLLDGLKRRYIELHDYQRYAQYAAESEMHHTPAGRLPRELDEFRARLEARPPAANEIGPLLASLPN
jgi:hypothetical protein